MNFVVGLAVGLALMLAGVYLTWRNSQVMRPSKAQEWLGTLTILAGFVAMIFAALHS